MRVRIYARAARGCDQCARRRDTDMSGHTCFVLALAAVLAVGVQSRPEKRTVCVRTDAGCVRGLVRKADDGSDYASFRGVPYAKQPVGKARFKELEPLKPWTECREAIEEGPVCLQTDVLYKTLMQPREMSEECIYANIHVPMKALPKIDCSLATNVQTLSTSEQPAGLPILVFIHGGGFAFGSGDSDIHGPEYLVSKDVIVITFNYRLNVFGFLSLNTKEVPGNAGLRDMLTLLRWVQKNAPNFGGDPDNVTLAGQSAGSIAAHLLTLSKAAENLFKRTILMSGTAISKFYSPSPVYAHFIKMQLLAVLQINATDPEEIHQMLIDMPAEKLSEANRFLLSQTGLVTFVPTVETLFPDVIPVVADYPEVLLANGRGKNISLLVGYTSAECETFRRPLEDFNLVQKVKENPALIVPPEVLFSSLPSSISEVAKKIVRKYYNGTISLEGFVNSCTDGFYEYPVMKLVEERGKSQEAPIYVYKFSYESDCSLFKRSEGLRYHGAGHIEDLSYVFKTNSLIRQHRACLPRYDDDGIKQLMTDFFVNFMYCSKPICDQARTIWPPATSDKFLYEDIQSPYLYQTNGITRKQEEITEFFDTLTKAE